jgi:histidinol phosphatase-like enzyme
VAVDFEMFEMVQLLLEKGADVKGVYVRTPQKYTYSHEERRPNSKSIEAVVRSGNLDIAGLLLVYDSDLEALSANACDKIALKDPIRGNYIEVSRLLMVNLFSNS